MTDKTMTAERFIAKLRRRDVTSGQRLHQALVDAEYRFNRRESAWRCGLLADVVESERPPAVAMAQALGLEIDAQPEQPTNTELDAEAPDDDEPSSPSVTPPKPEIGEYAEVPERLMTPLSAERLAVAGKKR